MTASRTGGRILVDNLIAQGCDRIFTVPGESFLAVLDALHDSPQVDLVVCRQEGGVAYMADADARMTGRPGVAFVTRGPGATNAAVGVHVARQDSTPMLLFIGDVARGDRDREGFQEVDFAAMFAPLAKWAVRIDDAARIPEYVARAWSMALSGRPGPVVIALPEDMLTDEVEAVDRPNVGWVNQEFPPREMVMLHDLLEDAKRPIAIVGGAGWDRATSRCFTEWAEKVGIPVAGAFRRQDSIPNSSPVWAGNLGYGPNPKLVERVKNADLLLVVGARLGEATTDGYTLVTPEHPGQILVHVHPDPSELHKVYRTDYAFCCQPRGFSRTAWLGDHPLPHFDAGAKAHEEWLEWSSPQPREGAVLDMGQIVLALREALPADTIVCNGAGNFSAWFHRYWHYAACPSQLAPTNGSMGYGVPAAVAAALRAPERSVLAVAGDGDFLMNGQELATAVSRNADLLILVVDNGSYGTIRMHQEREYPGRVAGTSLVNPDFAALARAYGAWGGTVERTADFAGVLEQALGESGVRLIHLKTDVEQISPALTISGLRNTSR
jgi:acetolactate synthase-1/2/3 large subunit